MLSDYLSSNTILLQVPVHDWREAVRKAGDLLVKTGACEPRYVDSMIAAVEHFGPYMVLAPGIALAHARPEDGVLKVGISIVTLSTPVDFGSPENDPVCLVIAFSGVNHTSHMAMLQELALFLVEEPHQELLKAATDIETVLNAFSNERSEG